MRAVRLRTEQMQDPIGISIKTPTLSWNCEGGITQTAFEITAYHKGKSIWNSGKIMSSKMKMQFPGIVSSRQRICWKVRLWDEKDQAGELNEGVFEMGLLSPSDFAAKWINPEVPPREELHKPAGYLRKYFRVENGGFEQARLYITAHGLFEARINGEKAGRVTVGSGELDKTAEMVLMPGNSNYDLSIPCQTIDVTRLLKSGENELLVVLGDGWYRSASGVDGRRNLFGEDIALFCQLEIDGVIVVVSDNTWQASSMGPLRETDMQQGEFYDARMEEIKDWHEVKTEAFGTGKVTCSNTVPILEQECFPGRLMITPNGETVIDFGQNMAGYVEFDIHGAKGEQIVLWHGECLDENGNFTNANFQPGDRHKEGEIRQRITYICKEGRNHYKPRFTIMGFQYVKVETKLALEEAVFIAHAVYSRMEETGSFHCSSKELNQLVHNSIWSQKSNFCDIPTDCPTRERAGWTGDAGVFVQTGLYLMDCYPVFRKWLSECRMIQKKDGKISNIAPPNNKGSIFADMLSGSVGWGDACILVPWAMYQRYGELGILRENYDMMKRWYGFLVTRAGKSSIKNLLKKHPCKKYLIDSGIDYGEWCEPDVDSKKSMGKGTQSVATAYFYYSGRLLAQIAGLLGHQEEESQYREIAHQAGKAYYDAYTDHGRIHSDRQCEYVRPLAFGLLDEDDSRQAAADLNELVIRGDYHLNTGFLSTPYLCEVLTEYGYTETAARLLLQETAPGWLYSVKMGANTIWETWDAIRPDRTVHDSLNHYSYGAITGWLFQRICGIRIKSEELTIAPLLLPGLSFAEANYKSPIGAIGSKWWLEGEDCCFEFRIPANVRAQIILPDHSVRTVLAGTHEIRIKSSLNSPLSTF